MYATAVEQGVWETNLRGVDVGQAGRQASRSTIVVSCIERGRKVGVSGRPPAPQAHGLPLAASTNDLGLPCPAHGNARVCMPTPST